MQTALITGASRGPGRALRQPRRRRLAGHRRRSIRHRSHAAAAGWPDATAIPGDIIDDAHRQELVAAAGDRLDLLVLNASSLGQTPLPPLAGYRAEELRAVLEANTVAPLLLVQLALPVLRAAGGAVLAISSDAAVEGYPGWGGYGASKAALDQLARVLAAEEPDVRVLAVDPGDMRTAMQAAAFPGEDEPVPSGATPWPKSSRCRCDRATVVLPEHLLATAPPEARGIPRDRVRMLVATGGGFEHRSVADLPTMLRAGDLLVVNTSDTLPAALGGVTTAGQRVEVHLSTLDPAAPLDYPAALAGPASRWVVEVRTGVGGGPSGGELSLQDRTGTRIRLTGGGFLQLDSSVPAGSTSSRLWCGQLCTPIALGEWLHEYGAPIRYRYASAPWPLSAYRTEYADTPGSAEMPSAGWPLTSRLLYRLRARGVRVAALVLHTGVSSAESGEPPYAEWFAVPGSTAEAVQAARGEGHRVIAVGTTVVRALESAGAIGGVGSGWTDLVVTPERGVTTVDGLLTGWHEPAASHLQMLGALAGPDLLAASYAEALRAGYRWHEFGDVHLILPTG